MIDIGHHHYMIMMFDEYPSYYSGYQIYKCLIRRRSGIPIIKYQCNRYQRSWEKSFLSSMWVLLMYICMRSDNLRYILDLQSRFTIAVNSESNYYWGEVLTLSANYGRYNTIRWILAHGLYSIDDVGFIVYDTTDMRILRRFFYLIKNDSIMTILAWLCSNVQNDIFGWLVKKLAPMFYETMCFDDLPIKNRHDLINMCMTFVMWNGCLKDLKILVEKYGADLNYTDNPKYNPLSIVKNPNYGWDAERYVPMGEYIRLQK